MGIDTPTDSTVPSFSTVPAEPDEEVQPERVMTLADEIVERLEMGRDRALDFLLDVLPGRIVAALPKATAPTVPAEPEAREALERLEAACRAHILNQHRDDKQLTCSVCDPIKADLATIRATLAAPTSEAWIDATVKRLVDRVFHEGSHGPISLDFRHILRAALAAPDQRVGEE